MKYLTLTTHPSKDYELLDAGNGEKLERYGEVILSRPDPEVLWGKQLGIEKWDDTTARYERTGNSGKWIGKKLPKEWQISFSDMQFLIRPTTFKHTGLFPEQMENWKWIEKKLSGKPIRVLNLFGYTGGATLAAAKAGAEVTHVDASKTAVAWARENAKLSGLDAKSIHWIIEDATLFVKRELARGNTYDAIIMDPPAFGRGPNGEVWKIEEDLVPLLKNCIKLLSPTPIFFLINGYAAGYSPLAFAYNLESLVANYGGDIEYGTLAIAQSNSDRVLPCGIFARWSK